MPRFEGLRKNKENVTLWQYSPVETRSHTEQKEDGLIDAAAPSPPPPLRIFISATFLYPPSISLSIYISFSLPLSPSWRVSKRFWAGRHNGMLHRFGLGPPTHTTHNLAHNATSHTVAPWARNIQLRTHRRTTHTTQTQKTPLAQGKTQTFARTGISHKAHTCI